MISSSIAPKLGRTSVSLTHRLAFCCLLWVGFALPLHLLNRFPLREDEAIYSFWARHFWHIDPLFLTVWPDKPPLFLWSLATAFHFWGASQASGRLLNSMLTLLTALVIGATARRLWGQRSAWVATLLYLFNPFALSFAPTIYTDPMLVLAGQLAFLFALMGRGFGAGFWLAIAVMTKQQGVLYAPLIMIVLGTRGAPAATRAADGRVALWLRFGLGAFGVLAPLLYWDSLRWAVAPSPWDLSVRNYGAVQFVTLAAWPARSMAWAKLLWYFTASGFVWLWVGVASAGVLWQRSGVHYAPRPGNPGGWLALWSLGFLLLHIVTSVQIWDRYLLPLAPIFCLGLAWVSTHAANPFGRQHRVYGLTTGALLCLLALAPPALTAARGGLPIGGDHGAYDGLSEAIAWVQKDAPSRAALYHQQLGWHYQFYLFPQIATGAYELRWFPTAAYLAADAAKIPYRPRFLIQPEWAPQPTLALHLAVHRMRLTPVAHFGQMTVFTLQNDPTAQAHCAWCLCQGQMPWPTLYRPTLQRESRYP